jgi:hypothetical protein
MENQIPDDEHRDGNAEKPQKPVFHLTYSLLFLNSAHTPMLITDPTCFQRLPWINKLAR